MKANRILLFLICTVCTQTPVAWTQSGGQVWTLEQCIRYAREHNLGLKQSEVAVRSAAIDRRQAIESRFPSLNFSTSAGMSFGRTIDPTTNAFETQSLATNGYSLNSGVLLFNGNRINNTIRQAGVDVQAAAKDLEAAVNDLSLQVAQAYLAVLFSQENLETARRTLALTQEQSGQTEKLVSAGARPRGELLEIQSQVARDERLLITAENNLRLDWLSLRQLLQLPDATVLEIEKPDIDIEALEIVTDGEQVYRTALQTQPQVEAGRYRYESALLGERIARSAYYPTLSLFGNFSTNYSSLARQIDGYSLALSAPAPVILDGETKQVQFFQTVPNLVNQPFLSQFNQNLGVGVGVQLSVPIYSNGTTRAAVERARLNQYSVENRNQQVLLDLKNNVERAIADARGGRAAYQAALRSEAAAERAFSDADKRYNLGGSAVFEYTSARTRLDTARIESLVAKYDYIFRLKIIDFYLGKPITL